MRTLNCFLLCLFLTAVLTSAALGAPVLKTRELFTIKHGFQQPSDVAVGTNGRIYVLDGVNDRVKIFNRSGKYTASFGGSGSGSGKFNQPLGIGLDTQNRVYVADSGNHRVQVFDPDGVFIFQFSTEINEKGDKPSDPTDVAVNSDLNRCYVVDNDNHRVIVYDLDKRSIIRTVGTMGMEKKELRFPFFLDLDSNGQVYIVEVINTRVKVLDAQGGYVGNITSWGVEKGRVYRPKGVALDSKDRVFVTDSYMGVIQVFDTEGQFLFVLGDQNGEVLKLKSPTGLFVDKKMRLYVVEMLSNQVRVFSLAE